MNILLIMADQFASHALNRLRSTDQHFKTPHLDRLLETSVNFTQAYTSFPLCVPARSSMVTGRYPHQLGLMGNSLSGSAPTQPGHGPESLGHWFAAAGYDCAYAGKWHATSASSTAADGFTPIHPFGDVGLAEACTNWLEARKSTNPFLLVASFDDPHTICEYARGQAMPYGDVELPELAATPPLPDNFGQRPFAPEALSVEKESARRIYGSDTFSSDDWRKYRAAYAALVERADARIGQLLEGIDLDTTSVVFLSDHGDGDSSHRWNQKTALHQECIKIPLLIHLPGAKPRTAEKPVAGILALLPTLCDIAGVGAPARLPASSVLSENLDRQPQDVVVSTSFGDTFPHNSGAASAGRALISGRYKYTIYSWGKYREQLHDLHNDPSELRNLAVEGAFAPELERMRGRLLDWCQAHSDWAFLKKLRIPAEESTKRRAIFKVPY